jgi:potassium efflux system protein
MGALALFVARILRPTTGIFREYLAYHKDGWLDRLRFLWYWLAVLVPVAPAVLSFLGYHYTAIELTKRLLETLCLFGALILLRAILLRWLIVNRRRLSIQQARERRAAAIAAHAAAQATDSGPESIVLPTEEPADLAQLSSQTQRLLTMCVVVASLVGVWSIWDDVFPAFTILERWSLWTTVAEVRETTTDESGETLVTKREEIRDITIAHLLLAGFVITVTIVAFRNIPGLLEMFLLQRLPLEPSVRYAITSLASYVIILVGVVVAASSIGLRWNQIQWLATALTFGLAFGLQEIFANFVAGLIILFERPIRVGDIVTVDDVTGVVSRVRIRATTITNWDRKEYVVPNKEFITGRLLNWTLSDKINRVVVTVGLAYGSDTDRARQVLQQIVEEHPVLLDTPAPLVTFEGFGDSTLNLVLRAYLPDMDNRLATIHDLHTQIHKRFAEEGLEIAFPQMDLHVRSLEPTLHVSRKAHQRPSSSDNHDHAAATQETLEGNTQ